MSETDLIRIRHMLDAAREALSFVSGRNRIDLDHDRMLALSLVKELEIIGEAASKVSVELKNSTLEIPWAIVVGMRNRLIHAYFDVDLDIVWTTAVSKLPDLVDRLNRLVADSQ